MEHLKSIVSQEVRKYAAQGRGLNLRLFPLLDDANQTYSVVAVDNPRSDKYADPDSVGLVVFARIVAGKVVVEADNTDKPLVDALRQQGIPREKIVLAYAGEAVPDPISND